MKEQLLYELIFLLDLFHITVGQKLLGGP